MSDHLEVRVEGADGLAAAFEAAPEQAREVLIEVLDTSSVRLRDDWRRLARRTARRHGKRYPSSITSEVSASEGVMYADVGPDSALPQGGMGRGFEYGSVHTAPHPDGAASFAANVEPFERAVDDAVDRILRGAFG